MPRRFFRNRLKRAEILGKCRATGKLQYPDEDQARLDAKRLRKTKGPKVRPYICQHCEKWHNGHDRPPNRRRPKPVDNDL